MKHDIRRMALAAVIPLFLLFILYILKFLETGMDWNFTRLGVYPMEQRGVFGIFRTSTGTQQFQASVRQYDSTLFPDVVSVLFLPAYSPLHLLCHLDRMRCAYLSYRETGMAYRSQRHHIRTGFFFCSFSGILRKHVPLYRHFHC